MQTIPDLENAMREFQWPAKIKLKSELGIV